jgi:hypothetical protein
MNGTKQELDFTVNGADTMLEGMLIKDIHYSARSVLKS